MHAICDMLARRRARLCVLLAHYSTRRTGYAGGRSTPRCGTYLDCPLFTGGVDTATPANVYIYIYMHKPLWLQGPGTRHQEPGPKHREAPGGIMHQAPGTGYHEEHDAWAKRKWRQGRGGIMKTNLEHVLHLHSL